MTTEHERFAGKVVFVTGAASGIGRATAVAFAQADARAAGVSGGADQTPPSSRGYPLQLEVLRRRSPDLRLLSCLVDCLDVEGPIGEAERPQGRCADKYPAR
jgi:NAD(P)-dependent dehydrogenase (short-subunit alcohol dehydrogenase family)